MLRATVLIPTHDHGPTLKYPLRCALSQTVQNLEVLVIGDGVPEVTREIMADFIGRDGRVRFFDYPKGPHLGEAYRHEVLQEAQGRIVCYLSDDDLWLPDHIEAMEALLAEADFAHALPLRVEPDGRIQGWNIDFQVPWFRSQILSGRNRVPLSCGAHRLDSYRRLPQGWRTTPNDMPTDLYLWQKFLAQLEYRAVSGTRPTVLHFPSSARRGWTIEQRTDELERWYARLSEPHGYESFLKEVVDYLATDRMRWELKYHEARGEGDQLRAALEVIYNAARVRMRNAFLRLPLVGRQFLRAARAIEHFAREKGKIG